MEIGSRLKELRVLKDLTREELADRTELSKGSVSQLGRDLTPPSIATLMGILQCPGAAIDEFFNETPDEQVVFGKQDYFKKIDTNLNSETKWIIPDAQENVVESILLTLRAGGSIYPDNPHEGKESRYVLQGSMSIHIGSKIYEAKKGKSLYFTPDGKHYLTGKNRALPLWVSSPPGF